MITAEPRLIYTFHTNDDAIAFESACNESGIPGRLIPVPKDISAGCGLAWCGEPETADALSTLIQKNNLNFQEKNQTIIKILGL